MITLEIADLVTHLHRPDSFGFVDSLTPLAKSSGVWEVAQTDSRVGLNLSFAVTRILNRFRVLVAGNFSAGVGWEDDKPHNSADRYRMAEVSSAARQETRTSCSSANRR